MRPVLLFLVFVQTGFAATQTGIVKATKTPCCIDTILPGVCKALYNRNHKSFTRLCRTNPDFSFIQCCHSCHFNENLFTAKGRPVAADLYMRDAEELLLKKDPYLCFDRHGPTFCEAFVARRDHWARYGFTCEHAAFAFRLCRKTCGYCTGSLPATVAYSSAIASNPKECRSLV